MIGGNVANWGKQRKSGDGLMRWQCIARGPCGEENVPCRASRTCCGEFTLLARSLLLNDVKKYQDGFENRPYRQGRVSTGAQATYQRDVAALGRIFCGTSRGHFYATGGADGWAR